MRRRLPAVQCDLKAIMLQKLRGQLAELMEAFSARWRVMMHQTVNQEDIRDISQAIGSDFKQMIKDYPDLRFYAKRHRDCMLWVNDKVIDGNLQVLFCFPGLVTEEQDRNSTETLEKLGIPVDRNCMTC